MDSFWSFLDKVSVELFEAIDSMGEMGWALVSVVVLGAGYLFLRSGGRRL